MAIDRKFSVERTQLTLMTKNNGMLRTVEYEGHKIFPLGSRLRVDNRSYTIVPSSLDIDILTTAELDIITHDYVAKEI